MQRKADRQQATSVKLESREAMKFRPPQLHQGGSDQDKANRDAAIIAAGKTLKLSDSPWAQRGEPVEIDNLGGDDTRDELVSFVDHVRRGDPKTLVDGRAGLVNTATVLIANEAAETGQAVDFPPDLAIALG